MNTEPTCSPVEMHEYVHGQCPPWCQFRCLLFFTPNDVPYQCTLSQYHSGECSVQLRDSA